jgi:predicted nucleic acid-binding protein
VDLLIAVTAAENGALLWTLDKDFEPLIKKKYVRAFVPI